jgi:hypothetical protein
MRPTPRQLRRDRAPWSPIRSRALREHRHWQWGLRAFDGGCWRTTMTGRATQAALTEALKTIDTTRRTA